MFFYLFHIFPGSAVYAHYPHQPPQPPPGNLLIKISLRNVVLYWIPKYIRLEHHPSVGLCSLHHSLFHRNVKSSQRGFKVRAKLASVHVVLGCDVTMSYRQSRDGVGLDISGTATFNRETQGCWLLYFVGYITWNPLQHLQWLTWPQFSLLTCS